MSGQTYDIDNYYDVVLNLTKKCGQLIKQRISSRTKKVETKTGITDFVTETDTEVERLLTDGLSKSFPDHQFIGEESVSSGTPCVLSDAPTWIIDPVDGTMNFIHSFPHSCISIALFINKIPEIGIIYNPVLEQLFTARKGRGAYLNGEKIRVSNAKRLEDALVTFEFGSSKDPEKRRIMLENQEILMQQVHGLRALGSAGLNLSMVACGASDAHFEFGLHIWDFAAAELLITEAGGVVIDPAGGELDHLSRRCLAASSKEVAEQLAKQLVQYYPERD